MKVIRKESQLKKAKIIKKHLIRITIGAILVTSSCRHFDHQKISKTQIEYRDSLMIIYTLKEFYNKDWNVFRDDSKFYRIDTSKIKLKISRIFYSPDKRKMIAWVIKKSPNGPSYKQYSKDKKNNFLCSNYDGFVYDENALVGFRESENEIWKIYPLNNYRVGCASSELAATKLFEDYYFTKMKNDSEDVNKMFLNKNFGGEVRYDLEQEAIKNGYGDKDSPFISKEYGYNLLDKEFWSKSLIWQKGAMISMLYNFQTNGKVTSDQKDVELIPPKILYPTKILDMYK